MTHAMGNVILYHRNVEPNRIAAADNKKGMRG